MEKQILSVYDYALQESPMREAIAKGKVFCKICVSHDLCERNPGHICPLLCGVTVGNYPQYLKPPDKFTPVEKQIMEDLYGIATTLPSEAPMTIAVDKLQKKWEDRWKEEEEIRQLALLREKQEYETRYPKTTKTVDEVIAERNIKVNKETVKKITNEVHEDVVWSRLIEDKTLVNKTPVKKGLWGSFMEKLRGK